MIMVLVPVFTGAVAYGVAGLLRDSLFTLMNQSDFVAVNYRGETIPKGMGVIIPLASLIPLGGLLLYSAFTPVVFVWIILLLGMAFLGLLDDAAGNRDHGGFSQHFKALLQGKATTGSLKALYGGVLCLFAGWTLADSFVEKVVASLLIALATNSINLLDVRPGRALKGYALLAGAGVIGCLWTGNGGTVTWIHLGAAAAPMAAAAVLWRGDHGARYMLGDSGSNVLGVAVGLTLVSAPFMWQILWLVLFVALHLVAEKHSLSEVIQKTPLLDRIDRWGRS